MKKTLVFALALIAAAPVDGVAQLVNEVIEGRDCGGSSRVTCTYRSR